VPSDPFRERVSRKVSGGELKNHPFLFVGTALNLVAVQKEERFHSRVANPLVPINERVVHDQRVAKGSGLGDEVRVKVLTAEGGVGLRIRAHRGPALRWRRRCRRTAVGADQGPRRWIDTASGETPVEIAVLQQHPPRCLIEIGIGLSDEIVNRSSQKLFRLQSNALRLLPEGASLGIVNL
jgi:hypothetical protein